MYESESKSVSWSVMSSSLLPPWTVAHQAPLPMEFSRQEYWHGLPFPSPRDLPKPGIEPRSPALRVMTIYRRGLLGQPILKINNKLSI